MDEIKGPLASIVEVRNKNRSAIGKAELIAAKRWNSARISRCGVVEVVARIHRTVPRKVVATAVYLVRPRLNAHVHDDARLHSIIRACAFLRIELLD